MVYKHDDQPTRDQHQIKVLLSKTHDFLCEITVKKEEFVRFIN